MPSSKKRLAGSKADPKRKRTAQVPGQFYGYSLQITRAVAHLLRAHEGQSVSVEHLDDVASSGTAGVIAEQDKSGLAHNPVADRAIELWKALHNWVRVVRAGALQSDAKFVLYVAQGHHGSVIDRIHTAKDKAGAAALVEALRIEFWGPAPNREARATLPAGLAEHVNGVLSASDELLELLFVSISLENGSGSPNDDLLALLREKAISEGARDAVLTHLLGWVKRVVDKSIEKGLPAVIPWSDFHKQLVAAARKFDRSGSFLNATPTAFTQVDVETELRARTYVRQLEIVHCEEAEKVRAVNDFLRAAVDRTSWSEHGDVLEGSFQEFEGSLERAWQSQRTRVDIEQRGVIEEDRGRLLHANCMGLQLRLQGMDLPAHFVPGSFHTLSDALRVGWHPRYRDVIATTAASRTAASTGDEQEAAAPERGDPEHRSPSTGMPPSVSAGSVDNVGTGGDS